MPIQVAEFFIKFLTEPDDIVVDPFSGSNTTGAAAERLQRRWVAIEPQADYVLGSKGWFPTIRNELDIETRVEREQKV
jgi:site-specific DNA-methyltransferase (cytosine-N4-specific)